MPLLLFALNGCVVGTAVGTVAGAVVGTAVTVTTEVVKVPFKVAGAVMSDDDEKAREEPKAEGNTEEVPQSGQASAEDQAAAEPASGDQAR